MRLAAVLLVAVTLAGCVPPPDLGPPVPRELRFDRCAHQVALFGVPMAEAASRLPEGHEPVALDPSGERATLVALATTCASVDNASEEMRELLFALHVRPPESLLLEDASFHLVYTGLRTSSAAALAKYEAWNVTRARRDDILVDLGDPAARLATSRSGAGGATFSTVAATPTARIGAGELRAFSVQDGRVVGIVDYDYAPAQSRQAVATLDDPHGVSGFTLASATGRGMLEWGDDYGLVLRVAPLP